MGRQRHMIRKKHAQNIHTVQVNNKAVICSFASWPSAFEKEILYLNKLYVVK